MPAFATISDAQSFVFDASEFLDHLADELRYESDPKERGRIKAQMDEINEQMLFADEWIATRN